jgi:hypothetical protein
MIISNRKRFFGRGWVGVINSGEIRCSVGTVQGAIAVSRDVAFTNMDAIIAEAVLDDVIEGDALEAVHQRVLKSLDADGQAGMDIAEAIERAFASARNDGLVLTYDNQARRLIS